MKAPELTKEQVLHLFATQNCEAIKLIPHEQLINYTHEVTIGTVNLEEVLMLGADNSKIENVTFAPAGVKAVAYVGALKALNEKGIKPKRVGGTSTGSLPAMLLALGLSHDRAQSLFMDLNFKRFDNDEKAFEQTIRQTGIVPGGYIHNWIKEAIKESTENLKNMIRAKKVINPHDTEYDEFGNYNEKLTFAQLQKLVDKKVPGFSNLYVTALNLSTRCEVIFSAETFPDLEIHRAVRAGNAQEFLVSPERINGQDYADGGLIKSSSVQMFDYIRDDSGKRGIFNINTLGFITVNCETLDTSVRSVLKTKTSTNTLTNQDLVRAFVSVSSEGAQNDLIHRDKNRNVQIDDLKVQTLDLQITDQMKRALMDKGYEATKKCLEDREKLKANHDLIIEGIMKRPSISLPITETSAEKKPVRTLSFVEREESKGKERDNKLASPKKEAPKEVTKIGVQPMSDASSEKPISARSLIVSERKEPKVEDKSSVVEDTVKAEKTSSPHSFVSKIGRSKSYTQLDAIKGKSLDDKSSEKKESCIIS